MRHFSYGLIGMCLLLACNRHQQVLHLSAQAPLIVYRTKSDYLHLVPVQLDEGKSRIVSYPHPSDLKAGSDFRYPVKLKQGYLLDNQGINSNVAFLDMTYEEYGALEFAPDLETMFQRIKDKDPIRDMFHAGNTLQYPDPATEINRWIRHDSLSAKAARLK